MKQVRLYIIATCVAICCTATASAQELFAKVTINHNQIQGTDASIFENLQQTLEQFINERQWTNLQFQKNERINCNFNITVTKYDKDNNLFKDMIDNQLTALIAYYAFLIIGMDLDSFSPMGGESILQRCMNLTNNAQNLSFTGWKSFDSDRNRFAFINSYLDGAMQPFRQLQYDYYRTGLDEMANNVERGRTNITTALENDLKKCHEDRPLSLLPQIWTDYKKDELANIYKGKGTQKEKETVYDILFSINASQNNTWEKIKQ